MFTQVKLQKEKVPSSTLGLRRPSLRNPKVEDNSSVQSVGQYFRALQKDNEMDGNGHAELMVSCL